MSKESFGIIFAAGTITYAFSFLLNGPVTDRIGGKKGMLIGATGAALMNILMGVFVYGILRLGWALDLTGVFSVLYSLNMYFQSYGAVAIVKVNASWFHVRERGVFGGIFGILISLGLYFAFDWSQAVVNLTERLSPASPQYWLVFKESIKSATAVLQKHRNLDEDYCRVKVVNIEEVSVCADVELKPDADIEWVEARIWFEIERYSNPPVPFYTLQELMDAGEPVEEIFNGPELNSGFIKRADLEAASLKSELRVSDIINLLMDIYGVIAVNQLQLTKYDAEVQYRQGRCRPGLE